MRNYPSWYQSGNTLRLFFVDGRATIFLIIGLYHPSYFTLGVGFLVMVILAILENKDYTIPNALRMLKVFIFGRYRPAVLGKRKGRSDR